ncbi:MAG: ABC transporter [Firmicutes bacterium HGW-Firmicutes-14]|nr:MAG: ABC transporter [Firmicutes bacterium HGW-Firmicutes-14]
MEPFVEVFLKKVAFPGDEKPALSGIELRIEKGEFIVITGPAASGKSVLCHCLTGAVPHFYPAFQDGFVRIGDTVLSELSLPRIAGKVGYMMQDPQNQLFSTTVGEDVAFGPGNMGLPRREVRKRVREALEFVGLSGFENRLPETLSGGEAQRVVLAGVFSLKPEFLVLDQPAAELDPAGRKDIYDRLGELSRSGKSTIIMVSERPEELVQHANRYLVMEEGRIVRDSSSPPVQGPYPGIPAIFRKKQTVEPGQEAASLENCTYTYPDGRAGCLDTDLRLFRGQMVALMGLNGSGKTTVAKHFNGLLRPASGTVRVLGREISDIDLHILCRKVGFLFQNPDFQIFAGTVEEEAAFGLKIQRLPPEQITDRVEDVLKGAGLLQMRKVHPHRLSRGQRQMLALASVLAAEPEIVIADEPTAGLNYSQTCQIMDNLARLADEGKAVLLVTHDVMLTACYAHRLVAMHRHRVQLDLPVSQLPVYTTELQKIGLDFSPAFAGWSA